MRMDLPLCSFKDCRKNFDSNCMATKGHREGCEYLINKNYNDLEEQGLLAIFPCKVGDTVYTIGVNNAPCEKCTHGEEVDYDVMECLVNHNEYECPMPERFIEEKKCNGFEITSEGIELVEEWGYDMTHIFEPYFFTKEEAEKALNSKDAVKK